jgi:hypothetical protein
MSCLKINKGKHMSPTEEMYRSKTNNQLKEMLEVFELSTPNAKNPFKPNKDEMVFALMKFKRHQDKINGIEPEDGDVDPENVSEDAEDEEEEYLDDEQAAYPKRKRLTKAESINLMKADLFRMERVIVHDTQTSQTSAKSRTISWGNRYLGVQNDIIQFGTPWYIRRGAIKNLEVAEITEYVTDEDTQKMTVENRKRFQVTYLDGWTEDELAMKAQDQKIRDSRLS